MSKQYAKISETIGSVEAMELAYDMIQDGKIRLTIYDYQDIEKERNYKVVDSYNENEKLNAENEDREPNYLPRFSAHTLRHTACTRMATNRMCPRVLQEIIWA